jgi:uncharacterized protein YxjI
MIHDPRTLNTLQMIHDPRTLQPKILFPAPSLTIFTLKHTKMKIRYQLKEKAWTFKDTYEIYDHHGNKAYVVKGKMFSWGDKLSFRDKKNEEILLIDQRQISLKPSYKILQDGELIGELTKEFSWARKKFELDVPGRNDYVIKGSFWDREFSFKRDGKEVAEVSKKFWSIGDSYGVEIEKGENHPLILATIVVIDLILEGGGGDAEE